MISRFYLNYIHDNQVVKIIFLPLCEVKQMLQNGVITWSESDMKSIVELLRRNEGKSDTVVSTKECLVQDSWPGRTSLSL